MPAEFDPEFAALLEEASCGNNDALQCLMLATTYMHLFDDVVDGDLKLTAANLVKVNNIFARLLTCNFFIANKAILLAQLLLIGECYAAAEEYKTSGFEKRREWSNYMRHCGNDFIRAVALLCGGEAGLIYVSRKLREYSLKDHYDESGNPK